jgi:hypothetical protein
MAFTPVMSVHRNRITGTPNVAACPPNTGCWLDWGDARSSYSVSMCLSCKQLHLSPLKSIHRVWLSEVCLFLGGSICNHNKEKKLQGCQMLRLCLMYVRRCVSISVICVM